MTICYWNESPVTFENSQRQGEIGKNGPTAALPGKVSIAVFVWVMDVGYLTLTWGCSVLLSFCALSRMSCDHQSCIVAVGGL